MVWGVGVSPDCEDCPASVRLQPRGSMSRVFVAVPVILGGCFSVHGVEDRTILYICSMVVYFLASRPVVRPGR